MSGDGGETGKCYLKTAAEVNVLEAQRKKEEGDSSSTATIVWAVVGSVLLLGAIGGGAYYVNKQKSGAGEGEGPDQYNQMDQ